MAPFAHLSVESVEEAVTLHDTYPGVSEKYLPAVKTALPPVFAHVCSNRQATEQPPCVRCLLDQHRSAVATLREGLQEETGAEQADDLWLLRFILSFPNVPEALSTAKQALKWRQENHALLEKVQSRVAPESNDTITRNMASAFHGYTNDGAPINITRLGHMTPKAIGQVPEQHVFDWFMYQKELCFRICDEASRRTGRLIKSVNFIDFAGMKFFSGGDKTCERILSETSKLAETIYPQLVHLNVLFNIPTGLGWVVSAVKKLLPKKMADKIVLCNVPTHKKGEVEKCPVVRQLACLDTLPSFLGGRCMCSGGCVPHTPH